MLIDFFLFLYLSDFIIIIAENPHFYYFLYSSRKCRANSMVTFVLGICFGAVLMLLAVVNERSLTKMFENKFQFSVKNEIPSFVTFINPNATAKTTEEFRKNETELSDMIAKHIKILCWIMTQPKDHLTKAQAVRETWGKRCDVFYYVSTQEVVLDSTLPPLKTVIYEGSEGRSILWQKTQLGFKYAYDNHFDDADWFLKADDDTYVVMENLRLLLLDKDPSEPVYYGCRYKGGGGRKDWVSGGPGYILSKEALKRFAEDAYNPTSSCHKTSSGHEDSELGLCMDTVNVTVGDSSDPEGKPRFFHFQMYSMLNPRHILYPIYWATMATNHTVGENCCSNSIIGMHYIDENLTRILDYVIYKVHPFGINPILTGADQMNEIRDYLQQKILKNITKNSNSKYPLI